MPPLQPCPHPVRAAQYLRMSTEHQNYSIEGQTKAIAAYAQVRGYDIVRSYSDYGISGVKLARRAGLKQLLADVLGGAADFEVILTYDVSRWGRFQDPDQSAHYEYLCKEAGVRVEYCAEQFANDGSLTASLVKHLKRAMAAEFSRELSAKIAMSKLGLAAKGYWQSGAPGYGLRRMAVTPDGACRSVLEVGERKGVAGDRSVLVHGPPEEVATVRRIYRLFVVAGLSFRSIVRLLNSEGVPGVGGTAWTTAKVRGVLTDEKYVGTYVYGRTRERFRERTYVRPESWIRAPQALEPMVSRGMFDLAQQVRGRWKPHASDEVLLAELRGVLADCGRLSADVIDAHPAAHCAEVYRRRFGGLEGAYARIGYVVSRAQKGRIAGIARNRTLRHARFAGLTDEHLLAMLRKLLAETGEMSFALINAQPGWPGAGVFSRRFGGMAGVYEQLGYRPSEAQQARIRGRDGGTRRRTEA